MARIVKGEKRGERYAGKWLVDYRDAAGVRHLPSFDTKAAAEDFYARVALPVARRDRVAFQADRKTTLQQCFDRWLTICKTGGVKQASVNRYTETWKRYVSGLAPLEARTMTRQRGEGLLLRLAERVGQPSLRLTWRVLNGACGEAVELGLLAVNPMTGLLKRLRLNRNTKRGSEDMKAMTREQAGKFLAACPPRFFPVFHTMIETGLRIGEALALTWEDVNLDAGVMTVSKTTTCADKEVGPTKMGDTGDVDLSQDVVATLKAWMLKTGRREGLVFPLCQKYASTRRAVEKEMYRALQRASLPVHFSPHSLRHTFAAILLSEGVPIQYVQKQLRHASISMTVDTYGRWLPQQGRHVDTLRLAQPAGLKLVATSGNKN